MPEIETDKLDNFKKTNSEKDEPNPDDFVNNGKFDYWKRRALHTVLEELLKHLRNHGIFWNREDKACSYISYILSEEVKAKNYTYDQEIFETFKGFINKYNTRPNFKSPHCSTSLVHVDSKMYDKMGKLYEMYELFKKFKDDNKLWQAESCSPVEAFLNQFNDFIRNNQPTNNDFKHILDEFRKEIKKDVDLFNRHICSGKYIHVENIKSPILPKEKQTEALVQVEQKPNHTPHEVSQSKSPPSLTEHRTVNSHPEVHHAQSERTHEQPQPIPEETQPFQERVPPNAQHAERQQVQRFTQRVIPEGELDVDSSQENLPHYGSYEIPGTPPYSERYKHLSEQPSSNEAGDTSSSVMNTITSALRDVEPGPVLGVSGGMGVLFLLFKYTPVGSSFGGRRGRFRQIPRSFGGFPPGDFGNFQEYDGGYVGYSQMDMPFQGE